MRGSRIALAASLQALLFCGVGCMHPQIMDPFSTGFAENEYLVIRITDTDQLGQLYEALPQVDDKGRSLPLRWRGTTKMLFPTAETVNKVKATAQEQVRYAFEKVGGGAKLTAAAVADLSVSADAAYKYESKSSSADRFDMQTLKYAEPGADYMRTRLAQDSRYQFAYLSAIYRGVAFVEVLSNVKSGGTGSYAAFQMGSDYYASANKNIATSGPIIFQLTPIDLLEVGSPSKGGPVPPPRTRFEPLTSEELSAIKRTMPQNLQKMLE